MQTDISAKLMTRAEKVIPGGVNSPVRAFGQVDDKVRFIKRGEGPYIYDADDNQYIDYVCSWGPLILGHKHPAIVAALEVAINSGVSFGASTEVEVKLAELIVELVPSIEMVRMVNSGTEATMSAIRLARGFTKRNKILKFNSCYHGHSDSMLVAAGSGLLTLSLPASSGIPDGLIADTLVAPFNDLKAVEEIFSTYGNEIAGVIVEPIAANMGLVLPEARFLTGLRELCNKHGSVLIFDEVITGFRVSLGGAQQLYGVEPDLTCLGKIVGGGLPVGAFGGRKEVMKNLAPLGDVYQAGTLSGNPLAMSAGLATIQQLKASADTYTKLASTTKCLAIGVQELAGKYGIKLKVNRTVGIFALEFIADKEYKIFKRFFSKMLAKGVYLAPSPYEVGFISLVHDEQVITKTLAVVEVVFAEMKSETDLT